MLVQCFQQTFHESLLLRYDVFSIFKKTRATIQTNTNRSFVSILASRPSLSSHQSSNWLKPLSFPVRLHLYKYFTVENTREGAYLLLRILTLPIDSVFIVVCRSNGIINHSQLQPNILLHLPLHSSVKIFCLIARISSDKFWTRTMLFLAFFHFLPCLLREVSFSAINWYVITNLR